MMHINNFFFFNVLGINENFAARRLSVNELPLYLLGYREKCHYALHLDNLRKCAMESGNTQGEVTVYLSDKKTETLEFDRVILDKEYVLDEIADYLTGLIREYWRAVKRKEGIQDEKVQKIDNEIMELYRDVCVCLALYEIFIKEFQEEEWGLYLKYQRFLGEVSECLVRANTEEKEEVEEVLKWIEKLHKKREHYRLIEKMEQHERMYLAVTQCVAFIELLNMEDFFY